MNEVKVVPVVDGDIYTILSLIFTVDFFGVGIYRRIMTFIERP